MLDRLRLEERSRDESWSTCRKIIPATEWTATGSIVDIPPCETDAREGHGDVDAASEVGPRREAGRLVTLPGVQCHAGWWRHTTGLRRHLCAVLYSVALGNRLFPADRGSTPGVAGGRSRAPVRGRRDATCPPRRSAAQLTPLSTVARIGTIAPGAAFEASARKSTKQRNLGSEDRRSCTQPPDALASARAQLEEAGDGREPNESTEP